ncbi:MAG: DUF1015 domain-containing protein [Eubacterium sp.]|nr:DUF1015 domain-containing protein [Eubacterium sp.]
MAHIHAFRAYRPAKGNEYTVTALPYDVYDKTEARAAVLEAPDSFLSIDRPEAHFPEDADMYAPAVYEKAAEILQSWIGKGVFVQEESPCLYIWELTMEGRVQTGLVSCIAADDYRNGIIKKHENTREEKERDRVRHIEACGAQTGPVLLGYHSRKEMQELLRRFSAGMPLYDFTDRSGIAHRIWAVSAEEDIRALTEAAGNIDALYIADGHHRASAACTIAAKQAADGPEAESQYFLGVMFPDDELYILAYNRILKGLNGHTPQEILEEIQKVFLLEGPQAEPFAPEKKGEIAMFLDGGWYLLTIKKELSGDDPVSSLDVEYLQKSLLEPVFGILKPGSDPGIVYVGGDHSAQQLEARCRKEGGAAFMLYPTAMQELMAVADNGMLMPPKSTWFEPKLRTGLLIHMI